MKGAPVLDGVSQWDFLVQGGEFSDSGAAFKPRTGHTSHASLPFLRPLTSTIPLFLQLCQTCLIFFRLKLVCVPPLLEKGMLHNLNSEAFGSGGAIRLGDYKLIVEPKVSEAEVYTYAQHVLQVPSRQLKYRTIL